MGTWNESALVFELNISTKTVTDSTSNNQPSTMRVFQSLCIHTVQIKALFCSIVPLLPPLWSLLIQCQQRTVDHSRYHNGIVSPSNISCTYTPGRLTL